MEVLHFPESQRPPWLVQPVLALGNFDGLHRGHLKVIERVKRGAAELGGIAMVMTFDPHPPRVVRPDKAPLLMMTHEQRLEGLDRAGIHCVAVVRFTLDLSRWDPETFVRTVLVDWLRVAEVWVGGNFLFGHERSGNFTLLRTLGQRYGFRAGKIDPVRYKEFVVSSTRIRRLVSEGRMDKAAALLGHPYCLLGSIVEGRRDASQQDRTHDQRRHWIARQADDDGAAQTAKPHGSSRLYGSLDTVPVHTQRFERGGHEVPITCADAPGRDEHVHV